MIKRGVVASVNNKKEQIKDSIKESVMNVPLIGSMIKKRDDDKKQKEDGQLQGSFTQLSDTSNQQVQILKQSNIILTQISDNVYNIAGKLGAELSSLDEVKQIFKDRARQEAIDSIKIKSRKSELLALQEEEKLVSATSNLQKEFINLEITDRKNDCIRFERQLRDTVYERDDILKLIKEFSESEFSKLPDGTPLLDVFGNKELEEEMYTISSMPSEIFVG